MRQVKIELNVFHVENYEQPLPFDECFGYIVAKGFNENGIRVEFYAGEDTGEYFCKNALYVHVSYLENIND